MNATDLAYSEILPSDPRYRQLIQTALKARDKQALRALRNNTGQPIHLVTNWFYYALMKLDQPNGQAIVIYMPTTRQALAKHLSDRVAVVQSDISPTTYDFLL